MRKFVSPTKGRLSQEDLYRDIVAFMEGKKLDEIAKAREEGKRPYQSVMLALGTGLITFVIAIIFIYVLK